MNKLRKFINFKVLFGGGLVTVCLFSVFLIYLGSSRLKQPVSASGTAVLFVIAAPTSTPLIPQLIATPTIEPVQETETNPVVSDIGVGVYVQITGTEGDGLRMRSEPGLSGMIKFLAIDGEVFQVIDGPIALDGYTWWLLQALYDPGIQGWAVSDFMTVVQNP